MNNKLIIEEIEGPNEEPKEEPKEESKDDTKKKHKVEFREELIVVEMKETNPEILKEPMDEKINETNSEPKIEEIKTVPVKQSKSPFIDILKECIGKYDNNNGVQIVKKEPIINFRNFNSFITAINCFAYVILSNFNRPDALKYYFTEHPFQGAFELVLEGGLWAFIGKIISNWHLPYSSLIFNGIFGFINYTTLNKIYPNFGATRLVSLRSAYAAQ